MHGALFFEKEKSTENKIDIYGSTLKSSIQSNFFIILATIQRLANEYWTLYKPDLDIRIVDNHMILWNISKCFNKVTRGHFWEMRLLFVPPKNSRTQNRPHCRLRHRLKQNIFESRRDQTWLNFVFKRFLLLECATLSINYTNCYQMIKES